MSPKGTRDLRGWVAAQNPAPPDAFLELVDRGTPARDAAVLDTLLSEALSALEDALAEEGERRGAFRLLAADAYLTYASELALESEDPAGTLKRIVAEVVAEAEDG